MNSSNSFNICPRCGNSNALNAKYCSRCGSQLKVPTEAVVCHKCHTRNTSLANFCRNCGATLKVGAQTKICPRCGREIGAEENMCACGYSFVTMQQTEPKRADVSSTHKENKRDKKRDKNKRAEQVPAYSDQTSAPAASEKKTKQKKGGRGFALFAFFILAAFVVVILLPASARGPLVGFDKGIYHPVEDAEPEAMVGVASQLYAEDGEGEQDGEEPTTETWTINFANGIETVAIVKVTKGQKLTAEQIPAMTSIPEGLTFRGWFNGETQITTDTEINGDITAKAVFTAVGTIDLVPNPDTDPAAKLETNIYGWDLINDIVKLFSEETKAEMEGYEEGAFKYIMNVYFGTANFIVVAMFVLFLVTALLHLLVCLGRIIFPKRSKHANMLYLILAVITTILVALMFVSQMGSIPEGNFKTFFAPVYNNMSCSYGYVIVLIPAYYWFFWLYSCIAKRKMPKKEKKAKKNA